MLFEIVTRTVEQSRVVFLNFGVADLNAQAPVRWLSIPVQWDVAQEILVAELVTIRAFKGRHESIVIIDRGEEQVDEICLYPDHVVGLSLTMHDENGLRERDDQTKTECFQNSLHRGDFKSPEMPSLHVQGS